MKKVETLEAVIRRALDRELTKMQQEAGYLHDGWTGSALATWVAPGVIRSVKKHLTLSPPKRGKK